MGRREPVTKWYPTTTKPEKPKNHGKRCQCDLCRAAGVVVAAPSPQLGLRVAVAKMYGQPPPPIPAPAAPAERPSKEPKPKRAPPPPLPEVPYGPWPQVTDEEMNELRAANGLPLKGKGRRP